MDRRKFLISAIAAITAGTTMSISKAALADPVVGRYAMVVKMQGLVFKTSDMLQQRMTTIGVRHRSIIKQSNDLRVYELGEQLDTSVDTLLDYMLKNFTPTYDDTTVSLIGDLIHKRAIIDTMDIDELTKHIDAVVVVAVMLNIMRQKPIVPFIPKNLPSFNVFADQYKELILKC